MEVGWEILASGGVETIRLPPRSPNLNAYIERFVLSIKSEYLNRMVILGESHLRYAVRQYLEHYHHERNHQGLDNELIAANENGTGSIKRRKRLGGILSYYHREAA